MSIDGTILRKPRSKGSGTITLISYKTKKGHMSSEAPIDESTKVSSGVRKALDDVPQETKINVVCRLDSKGQPCEVCLAGERWVTPPVVQAAPPGLTITGKHGFERDERWCLSDGQVLEKKKFTICEIGSIQGNEGFRVCQDPAITRGKKYCRPDKWRKARQCYPFNFVQAPKSPKPRVWTYQASPGGSPPSFKQALLLAHPEMDQSRFVAGLHTGSVKITLTLLSPTIVSHPPTADHLLAPEERGAMRDVYDEANRERRGQYGETKIKEHKLSEGCTQRIRPSAQSSPGKYFLPATSLKGMLRKIFEAYSHSFMGVISEELKGEVTGNCSHTAPWRMTAAGLTRDEITHYAYDYDFDESLDGKTWRRWVKKGFTPYDKLDHVNPKKHPKSVSLACRLFGRVSDDKKIPSWAGRLRISDAMPLNNVAVADGYWFLRTLTRPSGAKAKCEALYVLPDSEGKTALYNDPNSEVRGRKFYLNHSLGGATHSGSLPLREACKLIGANAEGASDKLRDAVEAFRNRVWGSPHQHADTKSWLRPLLPGSQFSFAIRFENLTDIELGGLLKSVQLENDPSKGLEGAGHCHRLGRAKPLGFGSVHLNITKVELADMEKAYGELGPLPYKDDTSTRKIVEEAQRTFEEFCTAWRNPVWEDLNYVTWISEELTDYDYWKNFTDYQPVNKDFPLVLPKHHIIGKA